MPIESFQSLKKHFLLYFSIKEPHSTMLHTDYDSMSENLMDRSTINVAAAYRIKDERDTLIFIQEYALDV